MVFGVALRSSIVGAGFTTDSTMLARLLAGSGSSVEEAAVATTATLAGAGFGNGQASAAVNASAAVSPTAIAAFEQAMIGGMERLHIHPSGGAVTDVTAIPAGSAMLTTGAFTGDGPLLTTIMRYTRPAAPAVPVVGPVIEIARSDAGGRTPR